MSEALQQCVQVVVKTIYQNSDIWVEEKIQFHFFFFAWFQLISFLNHSLYINNEY